LDQGIFPGIPIDFSGDTAQCVTPLHGISGWSPGRGAFGILHEKFGDDLVNSFTFKGSATHGCLKSRIVNCHLNIMDCHPVSVSLGYV
jgi:hypothetical protein